MDVQVPGIGPVTLTFSRRKMELPFAIGLDDFEMQPYPGTDIPRDFIAHLTILNPDEPSEAARLFKGEAHLNNPLLYNGIKLSQTGWDPGEPTDPARTTRDANGHFTHQQRFTIMGVGNNLRGIHVIFLGACLIILGIPWAFYVKPLLAQHQKRKIQEELARNPDAWKPGPGLTTSGGAGGAGASGGGGKTHLPVTSMTDYSTTNDHPMKRFNLKSPNNFTPKPWMNPGAPGFFRGILPERRLFQKSYSLLAAFLVVTCCSWAWAQVRHAPDGNSLPDQPAPPALESSQPPPEALPDQSPKVMPRAEHDSFAGRVDLSAFAKLAVFDEGRSKIMETLAQEDLARIYGKARWRDQSAPQEDQFNYDPVFTYLDLIFNKPYYDDKPIIYVEVLDLRRAMLSMLPPDQQEIWLRRGRVTPEMLADPKLGEIVSISEHGTRTRFSARHRPGGNVGHGLPRARIAPAHGQPAPRLGHLGSPLRPDRHAHRLDRGRGAGPHSGRPRCSPHRHRAIQAAP